MFNHKWKNYKFDDLFEFEGSYSASREELGDEGVLYLHYGDMHTSSRNFVDVDNEYENLPRYKIKGTPKFLLNDGDLVFVDASEDYSGTCKTFLVKNKTNKPFVAGLHTFIARSKVDVVSNEFKKYLTEIPEVRRQIYKYVQGYKVYGINRDNLKKINVCLPNYDESLKIAEILDCWAKAVELQENKIRKLEEKKKALMQKLLTPKDDWDKIALNKLVKAKPSNLLIKNIKDRKGQYPVYGADGVSLMVDFYKYDCNAIGIITYGSGCGKVCFITGKHSILGTLTELHSCSDVNLKYIYYVLANFDFTKYKEISTTPNIYFDDFGKEIFSIPSRAEQNKIVAVLENIDYQIDKNIVYSEKLKMQQKALMQKLLTGEVRV